MQQVAEEWEPALLMACVLGFFHEVEANLVALLPSLLAGEVHELHLRVNGAEAHCVLIERLGSEAAVHAALARVCSAILQQVRQAGWLVTAPVVTDDGWGFAFTVQVHERIVQGLRAERSGGEVTQ
jgi:hypothetical protein